MPTELLAELELLALPLVALPPLVLLLELALPLRALWLTRVETLTSMLLSTRTD